MRTKLENFFQMHGDEPVVSSESDSEFGDERISTESDSALEETLPPIFRNVRRQLFHNPVRKKHVFIKRLIYFYVLLTVIICSIVFR